jgi:peroxiredoxin
LIEMGDRAGAAAGMSRERRREAAMAVTKGRTSTADATATLRVGDRAPEFVLTSHTGESWDSAQARGTNVVLAFYPFAFTPT